MEKVLSELNKIQVQTHLSEVRMERAPLIKLKESIKTSASPICLLKMATGHDEKPISTFNFQSHASRRKRESRLRQCFASF